MKRSINYASSPLLTSATPVGRSRFLVAVFALCFVGLAGRAAYVQIVGNDFFQQQGEVRFARTLELPPNRGRILDRNGLILASSVVAQSIWAIPEDVDMKDPKLAEAAKLLGISLADLKRRLEAHPSFVWIQRQVDEPVALQVRDLNIKGLHLRREYKRQYPESEAAAHVVGFTNVDDKGQEGIELAFNQRLSGTAGSRRVIKDRLGRVVEDVREAIQPVDGEDIQLSIDSKIQFFAYQRLREAVREHKAQGGSAVVLDAKTGEVLALANYPSYNPNSRQNLSGEQLRNRVLTDTFEPGSTMKPFPISLALEKGLVQPNTQMAIGKSLVVGKKAITDTHPYGSLTVAEVVQKSSNIGTVKMAMQLEAQEMWELFQALGFGQAPEIGFPGAVAGRLRPYKNWVPIDQATMSYGYGLSASLFQVARAYSIFARDGELVSTTIYKTDQSPKGVRVISAKTAIQMREMLEMVTQTGGTATGAQTMGYRVGGKTGTAHKVEGKGYAGNKYRGFFVGMAPMSAPRIVVAVMVDEPRSGGYYGGIVAAPAFSNIVAGTLRNMNVLPDAAIKQMVDQEFKSQNIKPAALTGGNNKVATTQ